MWKARFSLPAFTEKSRDWGKRDSWLSACRVVVPNERGFQWAEEKDAELVAKREEFMVKWKAKPEADKPRLVPEDGLD